MTIHYASRPSPTLVGGELAARMRVYSMMNMQEVAPALAVRR
ncbi:MAG: hypothetical protein ACTHW1_06485 [Ancrocorticia sp.]